MAVFSTGSSTVSASVGGRSWNFYCYKPTGTITGLLMVFHGSSRNASGYRDGAKDFADYKKYLVVTPLFTLEDFPSDSYQRGNIDGNLTNPSVWTTRYVRQMIDWARTKEEKPNLKTICYGFSAGGQFLSRVAAYDWPEQVAGIVIGSPSTHVRASGTDQNDTPPCPVDLDVTNDYPPYGFDGTMSGFTRYDGLKAYLKRPITIYLGTADNDPNDPELGDPNNDLGQGTNRLARGRFVFGEAQSNAAALGSNLGGSFGWKKVEAPGVGHSNGDMMRADEMEAACEFSTTPPPPPAFVPVLLADISDEVFVEFNNGTPPADMTAYRSTSAAPFWGIRVPRALNKFRELRWGTANFPQNPNNAFVPYTRADIPREVYTALRQDQSTADDTYVQNWGDRVSRMLNQFHLEEHGSA